jgi:hypothetical protein
MDKSDDTIIHQEFEIKAVVDDPKEQPCPDCGRLWAGPAARAPPPQSSHARQTSRSLPAIWNSY